MTRLLAEGAAGVDEETPPNRLAAQKHAKAHHVARGERQFDRPVGRAEPCHRLDHDPLFRLAIGARDPALVLDRRDGDDFGPGMALDRMEQEFRSEEHTSELQSLMRISYAVFCLKKKKK